MSPHPDAAEGSPVAQLNSDLQHAHLELVSAHCAVHQLRLHYSAEDLARFGRRDVLRKSAEAASALSDFYSSIEKKVAQPEPVPASFHPSHEMIAEAVDWLASYLHEQRNRYFSLSSDLSGQRKASLRHHFSPELLDAVRVVELQGAGVEVPEFFAKARAFGFDPPEITHMDSLTFLDVLVFNHHITERALFHALIHTVQLKTLGLRRYSELWIQSFIKTRTHFTVPLEIHAFSLASKFVRPSSEKFSVEQSVLRWVEEGRYEAAARGLTSSSAPQLVVPPPR